MPSPDTFAMAPVARLLDRWLDGRAVIVDPFARHSTRGTVRNDLSLLCDTDHHLEARDFLRLLANDGVTADAALLDPPYSPRQVAEVYRSVGRPVGRETTQNAKLYAECRDLFLPLLKPGAVAVSCGWNSCGFGKTRGFTLREVLIVAHGGAHNDTIVTVETYDGISEKVA
jgi:hypothetical protein